MNAVFTIKIFIKTSSRTISLLGGILSVLSNIVKGFTLCNQNKMDASLPFKFQSHLPGTTHIAFSSVKGSLRNKAHETFLGIHTKEARSSKREVT